ncbi:hypothetical protein RHGRI_001668 [Rhododendron griersonianum]|uniref:Uncharacterized protein n=1 Tax=Rhododendron griersonianum TaxID=479676 RepID=A0AAV6LP05_9ERIC|nr:hypothetical protein RHGRI_001668 [Rhododendron griersonianum]
MGHLYALDFDGVLCDSCGESSLSAVKAAKVRWPSLFDGVDSAMEDWIVDQMYKVRPVVETGYENLLLVRLLVEMRVPSICKSSVCIRHKGLTVEGILKNWSKIKPVIMEAWDESKDALIDLFGKVRDEWMENDLATWIGANRREQRLKKVVYFGNSHDGSDVMSLSKSSHCRSRFADALLRELAGVIIPPERIFGLGSGFSLLTDNFHQPQSRSAETASKETRKPGCDPTVRFLAAYLLV